MRKILFLFIFILTCLNVNSQVNVSKFKNVDVDKLIESIIHVESKGKNHAVSKDGSCVGPLQIRKIVVDDCNEYLKMKKSNKRYSYKDRYNKNKSIEMFLLIQERYKSTNRKKSKTNLEHMIRLWNGGCYYSIKKTQKYFEKVLKQYKNNKVN